MLGDSGSGIVVGCRTWVIEQPVDSCNSVGCAAVNMTAPGCNQTAEDNLHIPGTSVVAWDRVNTCLASPCLVPCCVVAEHR